MADIPVDLRKKFEAAWRDWNDAPTPRVSVAQWLYDKELLKHPEEPSLQMVCNWVESLPAFDYIGTDRAGEPHRFVGKMLRRDEVLSIIRGARCRAILDSMVRDAEAQGDYDRTEFSLEPTR